MVAITLPDGSVRNFDGPVSGAGLAADIGPGLAKAALAVKIDGDLRDLSRTIEADAHVEIVTRDHADALDLLRHDAAHVFAQAVQELFPDTQITFGPAIEDGFYYDFHREEPFTPDDFEAMEKRMQAIVDRDEEIIREIWDRDAAVKHFSESGESFKAEHIGTIDPDADISIYRQGGWLGLFTRPHVPSSRKPGKAD
nr:TGS domain-containing protein [Rhodospirillaceae bacterium]